MASTKGSKEVTSLQPGIDMQSKDSRNGGPPLSEMTSSKAMILAAEEGKATPVAPLHLDPHLGVLHPTSFLETLIHLLKGNIGSGLFAMGDAFKNAGLVAAPIITLVLGCICVYCQHMLVAGSEEMKRRTGITTLPTFAETVELSFKTGPPRLHRWAGTVKLWINIFLCITQMGFCCVYFVFISDNVKQVMDVYGIPLDVHIHMVMALLPILLSCWIRDLKYLVPVSLLANIFMTIGIVVTLYFMSLDIPPLSSRDYVAPWHTFPLFFGTVIFSFEGIGLVLPLQHEMRDPNKFGKKLGVLNTGMILVTSLLIIMGFLGYLKYGDKVEGSLTLNLPENNILGQTVKLAISAGILFTYAIQMYVPIAILWPGIQKRWGPFKHQVFAETVMRSVLVFITFVLAEVIPHLSLFISLVGAVSSTALALFFPAILDIVTHWESGWGTFNWRLWKDGAIICLGLVGFSTGTYASLDAIGRAL